MKMWTPTISERQVETIVEHKEGIDNYPEPGTRIIARLGQTVQHGTVQKQYTNSTRFMAFQVDGVRTGQQLLWFSDGWTFELKDDEQDDSSRA